MVWFDGWQQSCWALLVQRRIGAASRHHMWPRHGGCRRSCGGQVPSASSGSQHPLCWTRRSTARGGPRGTRVCGLWADRTMKRTSSPPVSGGLLVRWWFWFGQVR
jgi:hypothetical protein